LVVVLFDLELLTLFVESLVSVELLVLVEMGLIFVMVEMGLVFVVVWGEVEFLLGVLIRVDGVVRVGECAGIGFFYVYDFHF
jgi:hypothetical protein